jgi:hypothetical protein
MRRLPRAAAAALATLTTATTLVCATTLMAGPAAAAAAYDVPVEDYASYQPQTRCRETPRPGTQQLAEWIEARFDGGPASAAVRACSSGGASEHKEGRAIDWAMDAGDADSRREVRRFLDRIFATDGAGNAHARARRMGIMYVIWNDHMWASYDRFSRKDYVNGSCASAAACSATLRHRDHVHLSLSRPGGRGATSWYERD